jgi:hemolysin activation/secretion protein
VSVSPVLGAGARPGEGDLNVGVALDKPYGGTVTVDNAGNRYTGAYRLGANLWANSLLRFGDQLTFDGILTDESLWMGALGYAVPLGTSGLRGELRYAHTYYQLGKDFAVLDANGVADTVSAGLSYPLVRTQQGSVTLAAAYQDKQLRDNEGLLDTHDSTASNSVPVSLRFDWRDRLGAGWGGGVTYGALTWTPGQLDLDASQAAFDSVTAHTAGRYSKVNLDVTRLQGLPLGLTASGRLAAQWASKNLNSSESFGLGGVNGVRAYPEGEGYGDAGWVFQGELRYPVGAFTPYVFYDVGEVKINQDPWGPGANHRALQGAGIGVRWSGGRWSAGLSAAWRTNGGAPQSDTRDPRPRLWASLAYKLF